MKNASMKVGNAFPQIAGRLLIVMAMAGAVLALQVSPGPVHAAARRASTSAVQVSGGGNGAVCAVSVTHSANCYTDASGKDPLGVTHPPARSFTQLSVGLNSACGVYTDGSAACWGDDRYGELDGIGVVWPLDSVSALGSPATDTTCSPGPCQGFVGAPAGSFTQVDVGSVYACGVTTTQSILCWGAEGNIGAISPTVLTPPSGAFTEVSTGDNEACGLQTTGAVACWGLATESFSSTVYTQVSVGGSVASPIVCLLNSVGAVSCTGGQETRVDSVPSGRFASVSTGSFGACAVRTTHKLVCWGNAGKSSPAPPTGDFSAVDAWSHGDSVGGCAIGTKGKLYCWSHSSVGKARVIVTASFTAIGYGSPLPAVLPMVQGVNTNLQLLAKGKKPANVPSKTACAVKISLQVGQLPQVGSYKTDCTAKYKPKAKKVHKITARGTLYTYALPVIIQPYWCSGSTTDCTPSSVLSLGSGTNEPTVFSMTSGTPDLSPDTAGQPSCSLQGATTSVGTVSPCWQWRPVVCTDLTEGTFNSSVYPACSPDGQAALSPTVNRASLQIECYSSGAPGSSEPFSNTAIEPVTSWSTSGTYAPSAPGLYPTVCLSKGASQSSIPGQTCQPDTGVYCVWTSQSGDYITVSAVDDDALSVIS